MVLLIFYALFCNLNDNSQKKIVVRIYFGSMFIPLWLVFDVYYTFSYLKINNGVIIFIKIRHLDKNDLTFSVCIKYQCISAFQNYNLMVQRHYF